MSKKLELPYKLVMHRKAGSLMYYGVELKPGIYPVTVHDGTRTITYNVSWPLTFWIILAYSNGHFSVYPTRIKGHYKGLDTKLYVFPTLNQNHNSYRMCLGDFQQKIPRNYKEIAEFFVQKVLFSTTWNYHMGNTHRFRSVGTPPLDRWADLTLRNAKYGNKIKFVKHGCTTVLSLINCVAYLNEDTYRGAEARYRYAARRDPVTYQGLVRK